MAGHFAVMSAQDQAFLRDWNTYCCDQDHGQPSSGYPPAHSHVAAQQSGFAIPPAYPAHLPGAALSPPCSDQSCPLPASAVCCDEQGCPSAGIGGNIDPCCAAAHADCRDPACLGGQSGTGGTTSGPQTPCDEPGCMGPQAVCSDADCQFLENYLACCSAAAPIVSLSGPAKTLTQPATQHKQFQNPLLSPSSFDALLHAALEEPPQQGASTQHGSHLATGIAGAGQASQRYHPYQSAHPFVPSHSHQSSIASTVAGPSGAHQPKTAPATHICHWQNCHEQFDSVSSLLAHISVKHLETEPPAEILNGFYAGASAQSHDPTSGLSMDLGQPAQTAVSHSEPAQSAGAGPADSASHGLLACLWDDCLPPIDGSTFGAMSGWHDPQVDTASLNQYLSSGPAHSHPHPHVVHQPMRAHPVPADHSLPHGPASLDSATAVLKHLLQQHLGMDTTKGLLDMAAAHADPSTPVQSAAYESKSAAALPHACCWIDCGERFDSLAALTDHLSEVHVGKGKNEYECLWSGCVVCDCEDGEDEPACEHAHQGEAKQVAMMDPAKPTGKRFATRQKIMRHLQSHTGYRPYICPVCRQGFSEPATLQAHAARHAREKPFECDHPGCDKAFSVAASLKLHKKTHGEEQIHECPFCQKGFTDASNLRKHVRTHTGERPFICLHPGCTKRFSRPDLLKRHALTHVNKDKKMAAQREAEAARRRGSGEVETSPSRGSVSPEIVPVMAV